MDRARFFTFIFIAFFLSSGCDSAIKPETEVRIGSQAWAARNLEVNTFRDGTPITEAKSAIEWKKAAQNHQPAWCYYNFDFANNANFGKLYNWYAVSDSRGLAPEGWHIPNNQEWSVLIENLGGEFVAGNKMKSDSEWDSDENSNSLFSALPAGFCTQYGTFKNNGKECGFWSVTDYGEEIASLRVLKTGYIGVLINASNKNFGYSIRCIKNDSQSKSEDLKDSKSDDVRLGDQVWMRFNLNSTKFLNGDTISEAKSQSDWVMALNEHQPAWCYYQNDPKNGEKYGKLYNWYAISDPRGLAPEGYRISSSNDWNNLHKYLSKILDTHGKGSPSDISPYLKSVEGWSEDCFGNNGSSFSALPSGARDEYGTFYGLGFNCYFWHGAKDNVGDCNSFQLSCTYFANGRCSQGDGFSVRCLRGESPQ